MDLTTGKAIGVPEALIGYPSPLTAEEREQAISLAKENVPEAKELLTDGGNDVILDVLFESVTSDRSRDGKPGDRVVSLRIRNPSAKKQVAVNVNVAKKACVR